jgi:hypothetical protein
LDIVETVESTLAANPADNLESLDDVYNYDHAARETAGRMIRRNTVARAPAPMGL